MKTAAIVSIGNELLSGLGVDTNSSYLCSHLTTLNIPVAGIRVVGDDTQVIIDALNDAQSRADIIITTGGLGPTDDDITRRAVAEFLGVELEYRPELMRQITEYFSGRGLDAPEKNRGQAFMPAGSLAIENSLGTAPGIIAEHKNKLFICLPGVPAEMKDMFEQSVLNRLKAVPSEQVIMTRRVHCFGAGESAIAQKLGDLMNRSRNPLINCTASGGIITLHIIATAPSGQAAEQMIEKDYRQLKSILTSLIYGTDGQTLPEVVGLLLRAKSKSLAVAESCTAGLVAKMITDVAGSSEYFRCGWVTYGNNAKVNLLGIDKSLIEKHGSVSEEVACAMASSARVLAGADIGAGTTGIAGPGGASEQKPVGLVYTAVDFGGRIEVLKSIFSHSRDNIRTGAALAVLNMIRLGLDV